MTDDERCAYAVMRMTGAALRGVRPDDRMSEAEILSIFETQAARCADPVMARNQIILGLTYVVAGMVLHRSGHNLDDARRTVAELGELILNGARA